MSAENPIENQEEWELLQPIKRIRPIRKTIEMDMNPMVDLAFLLLTFFMLTTTFRQPQAMEIFYPINQDEKQQNEQLVKESKTFTILLGENNGLYYYQGISDPQLDTLNYSAVSVRQFLSEKNAQIDGLVVLIKPLPLASYKNFVDLLDELTITEVKRYSILEPSADDLQLIENYLSLK